MVRRQCIVRHPEYPQWGHGYVIRQKKSTAVVFFQWGGLHKVPVGVPLEEVRAAGVETDLFALCQKVPTQAWARGRRSVYAIELDRDVWKKKAFRQRNPGGAASGCLYVGVTGHRPEVRFAQHMAGVKSGRYVQAYGRRLRMDLVEGFSRLPHMIANCMEPKLAAWLRSKGFAVWQN